MVNTPSFALSLDSPPELLYAESTRRTTRHTLARHDCPHWGLDFYHSCGTIEFLDSGAIASFSPGSIGITSDHCPLAVRDEDDRESLYFAFAPARWALGSPRGSLARLPAIIEVGDEFPRLNQMAEHAVMTWGTNPSQACAIFWSLLWEITECAEGFHRKPSVSHPAVQKTMEIIDTRLGAELRVHQIARELHLAVPTLSRAFSRHTGMTLVSYIRRRRVQRATLLLENTDMPIKEIAFRVGIPDLQLFNKTFRRETGSSPRKRRLERRMDSSAHLREGMSLPRDHAPVRAMDHRSARAPAPSLLRA